MVKAGEEKIVGQEDQSGFLLGIEIVDAAQGIGIALGRSHSGQQNGLVAAQSGGAFDGTRVATVELHILFGAGDEEGASLREDIEASEVHITAIEQVKRSGFGKQLVQQVDVVNLAAGHINIGRNAAPQIQQRVQLHRALAAAKLPPGEQRQAQIDGGGVEGIHGLGQLHAERFVAVEVAGGGNQDSGRNRRRCASREARWRAANVLRETRPRKPI